MSLLRQFLNSEEERYRRCLADLEAVTDPSQAAGLVNQRAVEFLEAYAALGEDFIKVLADQLGYGPAAFRDRETLRSRVSRELEHRLYHFDQRLEAKLRTFAPMRQDLR